MAAGGFSSSRGKLLLVTGKVIGDADRGGFQPFGAVVPVGRADFAVLFGELQRLDHAEHLFDVPAQRQVVDGLVPHHAFPVDQEEAAERDRVVEQNSVAAADLLGEVRHHRVAELADAALAAFGGLPGVVAVLRIDRDRHEFGVQRAELLDRVVERDKFGRADEGEIHRVKEEDDIFAPETGKGEILNAVIRHDGLGGKIRRNGCYE